MVIFNQKVATEFLWLDQTLVSHVIYFQKNFQGAIDLRGKTSQDFWDFFIQFWAALYIVCPNLIRLYQDRKFTVGNFNELYKSNLIELQFSGVKLNN